MNNDIIQKMQTDLTQATSQQAEKIYNVDHIQNFNHTNQFYFTNGLLGMPDSVPRQLSFSKDYYHLIVYGQEPFHRDCHITLDKRRCLVESDNISSKLKEKYSPLTENIIEEIKEFLCILACENRHYGWTDEDHYATVAQLTDIKNRSNGIELYLHPMFGVSQARISELVFELGICGKYRKFNELNHTHWSIKQIDLIEVLRDHKLLPF